MRFAISLLLARLFSAQYYDGEMMVLEEDDSKSLTQMNYEDFVKSLYDLQEEEL